MTEHIRPGNSTERKKFEVISLPPTEEPKEGFRRLNVDLPMDAIHVLHDRGQASGTPITTQLSEAFSVFHLVDSTLRDGHPLMFFPPQVPEETQDSPIIAIYPMSATDAESAQRSLAGGLLLGMPAGVARFCLPKWLKGQGLLESTPDTQEPKTRVSVNVHDDVYETIQERMQRTGMTEAEQARRALLLLGSVETALRQGRSIALFPYVQGGRLQPTHTPQGMFFHGHIQPKPAVL